jgi:phosphoadenosine phosphosulfate reductase
VGSAEVSAAQKAEQAREIVSRALARPGLACITSSFQSEDMVVLHMILAARPDIPVLFLETGYHFPETIAYRERMAAEWKLRLVNLEARQSVAEQEAQFGILNQTNPDQCCKLRKVEPLFAGLAPYDIWFTGLRREQSPTRAHLQPAEAFRLPGGKTLERISPLYDWSRREVWQYMQGHAIPEHPLYERGYTSIGCAPCTALPADPNDARSGRWQGKGKLECGIHVQAE